MHIATAAHVLADVPSTKIRWCISRIQQLGDRKTRVHVTEFRTEKPLSDEGKVYRPRDPDAFDVGMLTILNESYIQGDAEKRLVPFIDKDQFPRLLTSPPTGHLMPGSEVAWCGYPGFVHEMLGSYHLCYYQGVVSAHVSSPKRPMYLVDGHAAHGVSGGPIWCCNRDGEPVILGVVSSYEGFQSGVPGLCAFTPLNTLFDHLEADGILQNKRAKSPTSEG